MRVYMHTDQNSMCIHTINIHMLSCSDRSRLEGVCVCVLVYMCTYMNMDTNPILDVYTSTVLTC